DGSIFLSGSGGPWYEGTEGTARIWETATGHPRGQPIPSRAGFVAHFSPDGKRVLASPDPRTAQLYDAVSGRPIDRPPLRHPETVRAVAISPDQRTIVTGSDDNYARLWDAATGEPIGEPMKHVAPVRAVAFSPDGRAVLTSDFAGGAKEARQNKLPTF